MQSVVDKPIGRLLQRNVDDFHSPPQTFKHYLSLF